jgi:DNA-binding response OmpR family regulator
MVKCALVVEDDADVQRMLRAMLLRHCSEVETVNDGAEAIDRLRREKYDVVVLDLMLPKMNGFQVAGVIESLQPPPLLIVLSGIARYFHDRFPEGTIVLQKPFEIDQLDAAMRGL